MSPTDTELVKRVLDGDVDAYGLLVARYRDRLGRYAYHMLGDRNEAEDAVQEALVRAYRFLHQCEQPDRFEAWVFRILANRCRTARVRRQRSRQVFVATDDRFEPMGREARPKTPVGGRRSIGPSSQLAPDQREAFLLKHVEDLSYEEMEAITGAGVSALKMRVKRACERLRGLLQEAQRCLNTPTCLPIG